MEPSFRFTYQEEVFVEEAMKEGEEGQLV